MGRKNSHKTPRPQYTGVKPSAVNGLLSTRTEFYRRELFRIIKGMFEIECPDDWNKEYILNILIRYGYLCISNKASEALPYYCTFLGYNYMGFPTDVRVILARTDGPEINFEAKLGKNAELIYFNWEGNGIFWNYGQIIDVFAQRLASCDAGIDVNIMNSRVAYIGEAESKAQADAIKVAFDRITQGDPLVVYRSDSLATKSLSVFYNNVKQNYIADVLQDTKRSIMNEFLTLLGINNANTDKKERLITGEVDSNNEELAINAETISRNLEFTCEKARKTTGADFCVHLIYDRKQKEELEEKKQQQAQQSKLEFTQGQNGDDKNDPKRNNGDMGHSKPGK